MEQSNKNAAVLEGRIGYRFKDREILTRALTHSSYSNETGLKNHHIFCNERLEFLGDSVLSIVSSRYLYTKFADCPEGELTRMRAEVVCERALSGYAESIGLGQHLLLGVGEEKNNGRERKSILADAFEAVIGAIYLDGGIENARKFVLDFVKEAAAKQMSFRDYKTELQEIIQKNPAEHLTYVLVGESGPDHDKRFEVEVRLNSNVMGCGIGKSKKLAEQEAARQALELMGIKS